MSTTTEFLITEFLNLFTGLSYWNFVMNEIYIFSAYYYDN